MRYSADLSRHLEGLKERAGYVDSYDMFPSVLVLRGPNMMGDNLNRRLGMFSLDLASQVEKLVDGISHWDHPLYRVTKYMVAERVIRGVNALEGVSGARIESEVFVGSKGIAVHTADNSRGFRVEEARKKAREMQRAFSFQQLVYTEEMEQEPVIPDLLRLQHFARACRFNMNGNEAVFYVPRRVVRMKSA